MEKKVLLVEDEARIREIVSDYFRAENYKVYEASNGKDALDIFNENDFDLVILDIMIPELDGWSVCKRIRKNSDVPIIMLTARCEEDDELMGFELGADEYVTKPFSPKVLVARANMLLKRAKGNINDNKVLNIGGIEINKLSHSVKIEDTYIELASKEYNLLIYLIENIDVVLTRENILNKVWGYDYFGDLRTVDTHIKKLRSKLGDKSKYIKTIIRAGYKFEVD